MNKVNLFSFYIVLYCFLYFLLTSVIYLYSMSHGYDGLGIPLFGGGDDGEFYYQEALNVADGRLAVLTSIHSVILGWILKVFQTDEVYILRAFNFIGSVLTLFVGLKILSTLQLNKKNLTGGILFVLLLAYYPSFLLNSNLSIARDAWIVFYYLLSILLLFNVLRLKEVFVKALYFIFLLLSLWLLFGYREYGLLSFLASSILYFSFIHKKPSMKRIRFLVLFLVIGFSVIYTFLKSFTFPIVHLSLQDILGYRADGIELYAGGSQMNISLDQSNVVLFYINYFYSIVSNVLGPLPWQFTGISSVIIFFAESLLFLFIVYQLYKYRNNIGKYDYFLIINSVVWFMLIGIFNDNIGTAARLRMVGWVPLFIVFAKVYGEQLVIRQALKKEATFK